MKLYEPFQFLTADECDEIIAYAKRHEIKPGTTLGSGNVRKNRIVWFKDSTNWGKWISMFNSIEPVIDWIQEPQISFYSPGEQYDWHVDTWPNYRTHIRHFTLTCELQTASGSAFEIANHDVPGLKKGEAVIFKPQDRHRATTPREGERISFTIWAMALNTDKH